MIDSGAPSPRGSSAPRGSGVTSAIADGGPGQVTGPRPDRRQLLELARSRQTMNVQRCMVLAAPRVTAGAAGCARDGRARAAGRRSARMTLTAAIARQTGSSSRTPARRRIRCRSRLARRRLGRCIVSPMPACRPGRPARPPWRRVAPGSATLAQRSQTARHVLDRPRSELSTSGIRSACVASARSAGRRRVERPAERPREERGHAAAIARRPRTATSAGRPCTTSVSTRRADPGSSTRVARAAAAASALHVARCGTTVSSLPVREQDRPLVAGDRRAALTSSTPWPRGRRYTRVVSQASG